MEFQNMSLAQLNEIANIYQTIGSGQVAQIWFDAGVQQSTAFIDFVQSFVVHTLGPNATCHSCENFGDTRISQVQWMGNEQGVMPYPNWCANGINCGPPEGNPYGVRWCASHCDIVLREHIWFWEPNPPPVSSVTTLVTKYLTSIGRGCNMILDMAPNRTGLLMEEDVQTYR
eukprot:402074_1